MRSGEDWYLAEPPGCVPVPVAAAAEVIDQRVILAESPTAFRRDMRAASGPYSRGGQTWLDVVSEYDWYRARIRSEAVPRSPYPADRVWVEQRGDQAAAATTTHPDQAAPALRPPRPAREAGEADDLVGRRVVVMQPDGPQYHRRAVSEPYLDATGDLSVTICAEYGWYQWAITREPPPTALVPIYLIWVE